MALIRSPIPFCRSWRLLRTPSLTRRPSKSIVFFAGGGSSIPVGTPAEVIATSTDAAQTAATVSNYFLAHPDTDAIFTMNSGPFGLETVLDVLRKENRTKDVTTVTFDVSEALCAAIKNGEAVASVDQLMYLQGYLPTVLARNYLDYGMMPESDILLACSGCEGRSTAPIHSRSIRCDLAKLPIIYQTFGSTTKLQHFQARSS